MKNNEYGYCELKYLITKLEQYYCFLQTTEYMIKLNDDICLMTHLVNARIMYDNLLKFNAKDKTDKSICLMNYFTKKIYDVCI